MRRREAGFTLLEVLIAMAVLVFISFGIYQATTETYRLRDILTHEGDFYNGIRLAMDILRRDVSLIYSPTLIAPPKKESSSGLPDAADARDMAALMSTELGVTSNYWLPAIDKSGIRPSRFVGNDSKMSFVALSHIRIYKDAPESEFAKISYELQKDPNNPERMTLVKTENTNSFENDDTRDKSFIHTYPLLHGISKLQYKYYKRVEGDWKTYSSWDSDQEDFKRQYPDMIEITVSVLGPSRLSFDGIYKFRPEVPLRGLNPSF